MTKTVRFSIAAALVLTALLLSSCKSKTGSGSGALKTDEIEDASVVKLTADRDDVYNLSYKVEYPVSGVSDGVLQKMTDSIVEGVFGTSYAGMSVSDAANAYQKDRSGEFLAENKELLEDALSVEGLDDIVNLSWDETIQGYFLPSYKGIASYIIYNYVYEGGAHGTTTEIPININMETGAIVEESDFFVPGYESVLGGMISSHLRDAVSSDEDYESLFMKDVEPNGNFSISTSGVTYIYQPYEIGPYSLDVIEVLIPWDEIAPWVK